MSYGPIGSIPSLSSGGGGEEGSQNMGDAEAIWGGKHDRFKGEMGTNGSGGQIWRIRRHSTAHMDVADEGAQGGEVGGDQGDRKVVTTHGGDRATGVVATQRCFFVAGPYVGEKVLSPYDIMMVSY